MVSFMLIYSQVKSVIRNFFINRYMRNLLFVVSAVCRRAHIIVAESLNMSATTSDKIWIRKLPKQGMVTIWTWASRGAIKANCFKSLWKGTAKKEILLNFTCGIENYPNNMKWNLKFSTFQFLCIIHLKKFQPSVYFRVTIDH